MKCTEPGCGYEIKGPASKTQHYRWRHSSQPAPKPKPPAASIRSGFFYGSDAPTRMMPPQSDRGNAEALVGLPWVTWPSTPAACDKALDAIAVLEESAPPDTLAFWSSLKRYILAFRERIVPVGPSQTIEKKRWKNSSQPRFTGKAIA